MTFSTLPVLGPALQGAMRVARAAIADLSRDPAATLRVFAPPFLLGLIGLIFVTFIINPLTMFRPGRLALSMSLYWLFVGLCAIWAAVGWHRLILMREAPGPLGPRPHLTESLGYLMQSVLFYILTMLAGLAVGMVITNAHQHLGLMQMDVLLKAFWVLNALLMWLSLRILPVLPAAAIGRGDVGLGTAWRATKGHTGAFWVLTAGMLLLTYLLRQLQAPIDAALFRALAPEPMVMFGSTAQRFASGASALLFRAVLAIAFAALLTAIYRDIVAPRLSPLGEETA